MRRSVFAILGGVGIAACAVSHGMAQGVTIEGDAAALTLIVDQTNRTAVLAALADRLGLETSGNTIRDEPVSGRFIGDLPHVLQAVLDDNGFVIAYAEGRPVRIVLTGQASFSRANMSSDPIIPPQPVGQAPVGTAPPSLIQNNSDFSTPRLVPPAAAPPPAPVAPTQSDPL